MKEPRELELARKGTVEILSRRANLLGWNSVTGSDPLVITLLEADHVLRTYIQTEFKGRDPKLVASMVKAVSTLDETYPSKICKCINKIKFFGHKMIVRG